MLLGSPLVVILVGLLVDLLLRPFRLLVSNSVSSEPDWGKVVTRATQQIMRVIQRAALMLEEPTRF